MKKLMKALFGAWCVVLCARAAFAEVPGPLLVPDYNRDGMIDTVDFERARVGEAFTIWLNDDDDAEGTEGGAEAGDTNTDLHDVPGGEGNDRDCDDDTVNGRCDLLDFFPVLVDVKFVDNWMNMTWKLCSDSVNVVFTKLQAGKAGSFHTQEVQALDGDTPLYRAPVVNLTADGVALPDELFLNGTRGECVLLVEGRARGSRCLRLRGYAGEAFAAEVTLNLGVTDVESRYGWINLRNSQPSTFQPSTFQPFNSSSDNRHFILVHGYNTNHEEARGNAAEFYKKLYQSGSDAMFTAVEWRGDQSQIKFDLLGVNFSPNYHVNVENAFLAARPFADACKQLPGEKILVAHSLGNVLVSSAIKDYGLDYTKYVMLNAAVAREAFDANAYDEDMVDDDWLEDEVEVKGEGEGENALTNHLDRAARWYRNFAGKEYDPYEYRRKLAWRGRFANLSRTVNYYSQSDNILVNPAPNEPDPDKVFNPNDPEISRNVRELLEAKFVNGRSIGRGGIKKTGFGIWSFSEKMKGTWLLDVVNDVLTNTLEVAQADAYKREGGWGENPNYVEGIPFSPTNTHFMPFLDERLKTQGMLDILPAETERVRAQHLADAIPAESFAAGANPVATLKNVDEESFIGENPDWPLYEGEEVRTNLWNHSAFREVAFYHTSKFYASLAAAGKPRVIIDTDLGSSMDDLFTIDFAVRMHKAGKLDLMAVMMDRPDGCDPEDRGEFLKFADRYLASLGLGDLPLGKSMPLAEERIPQHVFNPYWTLIYSNNVTGVGALLPTNRTDEQIEQLPGAVALYRRLLNDAPDKSVVVCSTGFLTNLKGLMESGEDEGGDGIYSTGLELVAAKVKELRIMGGCFDPAVAPQETGGAEYNVVGDPVAAKKVFEQWPSPIVVSPWEVGLKLYYKSDDVLADFPAGTLDPVVRAAYTYWPDPGPDAMNRLWDPMTVLPLTEGETLVPLSEKGGISVDEATGVTTFVPDSSSNRCYQVASNMNAAAVMNRFRAICRTGNPFVSVVPISPAEPGVDYNGSVMSIELDGVELGQYAIEDLCASLTVEGEVYGPDEGSVNYDALGENVLYRRTRKLVQGRQEQAESETYWFNETDLEVPTNYLPATAMPERCRTTVETTVLFTGQTFTVEYQTATNAVQGAVRIVADGADGYKFQYYACVGKTNEDSFVRGWWDFNVGGEDVSEIKPVQGKEYTVRAEAHYFEDARGEENTLVISVEEVGSNRGMVKQFIGNIINKNGGQGGTTRLNSVGFEGEGAVSSLVGNYYTNIVNATLAKIDGEGEYATVAEAVAAANGSPIRLLWKASWKPTATDLGQPVKFLNKSWLNLDLSELPPGTRAVWSEVDGNNGTLTLSKVDLVGVCSWSWHEPMTNIIRRMEANGFKGIQLALSPWVWEGEGSAAQKETFGDQEGEEVFNLISNKFATGELDIHATMICFSNEDYTTEHTISNTCGFYYGLAPSATEEQKALADLTWTIRSNQFAKAVERTAALGVRNITAHIGLSEYDDANMSRLYWACRTCRENGCKLLVETGMYSAERTVAALERFAELHPDAEIGLNFDTANQILYGVDNPTNAYVVMKDWIEQVHIKDCYEPYDKRASWAQDIEWGRGDVSRTYGMIDFLRANGFAGPMLVEHESGSADPDVREREILTAVRAIRGEPAPTVAPGQPFGPFASRADAEEALKCGVVVFEPTDDVRTVLEGSEILSLAAYKAMFAPVIYSSENKYRVLYALTENATNALEQSVHTIVTNLDLAAIAAAPEEGVSMTLAGGIPGFYYTLFKSEDVTLVTDVGSHDKTNSDRLCDKTGTVTFEKVTKPSDAAGFFTVRVSPEQVFTGEADLAGAIVVISPILIRRVD